MRRALTNSCTSSSLHSPSHMSSPGTLCLRGAGARREPRREVAQRDAASAASAGMPRHAPVEVCVRVLAQHAARKLLGAFALRHAAVELAAALSLPSLLRTRRRCNASHARFRGARAPQRRTAALLRRPRLWRTLSSTQPVKWPVINGPAPSARECLSAPAPKQARPRSGASGGVYCHASCGR